MKAGRLDTHLAGLLKMARQWVESSDADSLLLLLDEPLDWTALAEAANGVKVVVASDTREAVDGAAAAGIPSVVLEMGNEAESEKLTQALLIAVANEVLLPGAAVVAIYSAFETGRMDSLSYIHLEEHLGRLTARDLKRLVTNVPLEVLKSVVDLAIEIGREGREGTPVRIFGTQNVIASGEIGAGVPMKSGAQFGLRYHYSLLKTVGEIATPFSEDEPEVLDFYTGSTFGLDLIGGYDLGKLTPYVALGFTDASTFFYIGDDGIVSNNPYPFFGFNGSLGVQARIKFLDLAAELYAVPGQIYTGRLRVGYLF